MTRRTVKDLVSDARAQIEELDVAQLRAELDAGTPCVIVDIRDFRERYELGIIPDAISAPRGMLEFWADPESPYHQERFDPAGRYVLHCASGWRSALAAQALQEIGYSNIAHLEPGFNGWRDAGEPVTDITATSKWVKRSDLS